MLIDDDWSVKVFGDSESHEIIAIPQANFINSILDVL
jgi:hypothetical protein